MRHHGIFYQLFVAEIVVLALLLLLIFITRLYRRIYFYFAKKKKRALVNRFVKALEGSSSLDATSLTLNEVLIEVIEEFDLRFLGGTWGEIKETLAKSFVVDRAHKWVKSLSWHKRNFAARTYALMPREQDESDIFHLLEDKHFLVYSFAAKAAVALKSERGLRAIFQRLTRESGYPYYALRDILMGGSRDVFEKIVELGKEEPFHKIALDCLAVRSLTVPIPYIKKDLESGNKECRLLALKILMRNPLKNNSDYYLKSLTDSDVGIRIESAKGLAEYHDERALEPLAKLLGDPVWRMRVEAGRALKKNGPSGIELLKQQTEKVARETATYVLEFG